MRFGPLRRVFMLIVLGAFLCVGLGQPTPSVDATPTGDMAGMSMTMDMSDSGTMPVPCKGKIPNCYSSMGCIFLVAIPPAYTPTATQLAWSRVAYPSVASSHAGLSLEPDLGPPIHA
mgnify:CR=1 FL=1